REVEVKPADLCESMGREPVRAAQMLVARARRDRAGLREAGIAWCEAFAADVAASDPERVGWELIFPLVEAATDELVPLHVWVERAKAPTYLHGARRWEEHFDATLLSATL